MTNIKTIVAIMVCYKQKYSPGNIVHLSKNGMIVQLDVLI